MSIGELFFYCFKVILVVFSGLATALSLLFMLSTSAFRTLEEMLGLEIGGEASVITLLEGQINLVNDWCYKNHMFLGPVLAVLAAYNTRSAFFM